MTIKLGKSIVASAGLAVLAVSAASLALASIPLAPEDPAESLELRDASNGLPGAVSGTGLFGGDRGPVCYDKDRVLTYFDGDRSTVGGELVTLETGFDQDFADTWRAATRIEPTAVSGVFAHIFAANETNMVDVVELGAEGCAISRTLLTEDEWNQLLVTAAGMSV